MDVVFSTLFGEFEWDSHKDELNRKNHGMSFEDAIAVFQDEMLVDLFDDDNSDIHEDRYKAYGYDGRFFNNRRHPYGKGREAKNYLRPKSYKIGEEVVL